MGWIQTMSENIKKGIRTWLNISPVYPTPIQITALLDWDNNAIKNRIWYRGDSAELQQLYQQIDAGVDSAKFWASRSTTMAIRKLHTGLPALIVNTLSDVTLDDMQIQISDTATAERWEAIADDNKISDVIADAVRQVLYIGDGAFRISFDTEITDKPIVDFFPGDRIELVRRRDRIREVIFKSAYKSGTQTYTLNEHYGYGYIRYHLYRGETEVPLSSIPETADLADMDFGAPEDKYMLAVPVMVKRSAKFSGRGSSIFDSKIDSFDALDETWSQWMDALRAGRATRYIPDNLLPRDPRTGTVLRPNAFDNRYIQTDSDLREGAQNRITVDQPAIPTDSYIQTYITALDMCLQGLISPSTLGIDVKKLDNAEAQREKEKTTLYTRNAIINALKDVLPVLVKTALRADADYFGSPARETEVTVEFGEYANPSFESQVETIGKAYSQGIMSVEAAVDALYGDDRDDVWKAEEIQRIKEKEKAGKGAEEKEKEEEKGIENLDLSEADESEKGKEEKGKEEEKKKEEKEKE